MEYFLTLSLQIGISTVYGFGEMMCCDPGKACPCSKGAITASGEVFDPDLVTAAIPAPKNLRIKPVEVYIRVEDGPCVVVRVNDKMNERFIGKRGFDLSPAAIEQLTGERSPKWFGRVYPCDGSEI